MEPNTDEELQPKNQKRIQKIYGGLLGLFDSRKGTLTLLVLTVSSIALFYHRMSGTEFGCIISTVTAFYNHYMIKDSGR